MKKRPGSIGPCASLLVAMAGLATWAHAAEPVGGSSPAPKPPAAFRISDAEGNNTLTVGGVIQFQYVANQRNTTAGGGEEFTHGFQNRRTRLQNRGTIGSKKLTYRFDGEFSDGNSDFVLLDVFGTYAFDDQTTLTFGQFKPRFFREEDVSFLRQLAVERSNVTRVFSVKYTQGLMLEHRAESWRLVGSFTDGADTPDLKYDEPNEADAAVTLRGDVKWGGIKWVECDEFTSFPGSEYGGSAGLGIHLQSGGETGSRTGATNDTDFISYTADVMLKGDGWNAHAAFVGRHLDAATSPEAYDDFGVLLQAGFFATEQIEPFARYEIVIPDGDRPSGDEVFPVVAVGATYYVIPQSHALKLQTDISYAFGNTVDSSSLVSGSPSTGLLSNGEDGQVFVRVYFQLVF